MQNFEIGYSANKLFPLLLGNFSAVLLN